MALISSNGATKSLFRFAKISEAKFRHFLRCFALDLTATQTAEMTGLSVRSVNDIFLRLRRKSPKNVNAVLRLAVSWKRMNPTSGHGAFAASEDVERVENIVFGLLKRGDQVYTEIVPDASRDRTGCVKSHATSHYSRQSKSTGGVAYRRLERVRRSRRPGLRQALPGPPRRQRVRLRRQPHQRHRKLLEPGKTTPRQIQRGTKTHLLSAPEGVGVPIQPKTKQPLQSSVIFSQKDSL